MSEEVKKEQNEQEETLYCECCGCLIDDDDYTEWNGQYHLFRLLGESHYHL